MKLSDLMKPQMSEYGYEDDKILQGNRIIALDGKDGKLLFDTRKNKPEFIERFMAGKVLHIWASTREMYSDTGFSGAVFQPCTMIYLSHDSWETKEKNNG